MRNRSHHDEYYEFKLATSNAKEYAEVQGYGTVLLMALLFVGCLTSMGTIGIGVFIAIACLVRHMTR